MRPRLAFGLAIAALFLSGCGGARPLDGARTAERLAPEQAMVDMPPGGPAILGVISTDFANAKRQEIVLANGSRTAGENRMTVTIFGPVAVSTGPENTAGNPPIDMGEVRRDMRAALPGVPMTVSPYFAQNRYGAFGYATGRSPQRDLCFYGWQRIRAPDLDDTLFSRRGTISIRLRLCDPKAEEADLVAVMAGFTINAYLRSPGWNPYGDPPPLAKGFGEAGTTILPDATVTAAIAPAAPPEAAVVRRTTRRAAPAPAAAPAPRSDFPKVPTPASGTMADPARFQDYDAVPMPGSGS